MIEIPKEENKNAEMKSMKDQIMALFARKIFAHIYFAWCKDCGERIQVDTAKYFRDELLLRNNKDSNNFNFRSLRAGKNFLMAFAGNLDSPSINNLDLADNAVTDMSMHTIKSLIEVKGF